MPLRCEHLELLQNCENIVMVQIESDSLCVGKLSVDFEPTFLGTMADGSVPSTPDLMWPMPLLPDAVEKDEVVY